MSKELKDIIRFYPMGVDGIRVLVGNSLQEYFVDGYRDSFINLYLPIYSPTKRAYSEIKPILRPLSQLTQKITHEGYNDGKPFVPIIELAMIAENRFNDTNVKVSAKETGYFCTWNTWIEDKMYTYLFCYNHIQDYFFLKSHPERYLIVVNTKSLYQHILSWHFNIFNLPKESYIEKI